jgi:hypothetical protein
MHRALLTRRERIAGCFGNAALRYVRPARKNRPFIAGLSLPAFYWRPSRPARKMQPDVSQSATDRFDIGEHSARKTCVCPKFAFFVNKLCKTC